MLSHNAVGADMSSVWLGGDGNWGDPGQWSTSPNFPNNGNGVTYDATINSGMASLDRDITIQRLFLGGGSLVGSFNLTLNDGLNWTGGELSSSGAINLAAGSTSNISGSALSLSGPTINNSGTVNQSSGLTSITDVGGIINNLPGATWNMHQGNEQGIAWLGLGASFTFNNSGSFLFLGLHGQFGVPATIDATFNNSGNVTLQTNPGGSYNLALNGGSSSGSFNLASQTGLIFGGPYTLTGGSTISGNGSTIISGTLNIAGNNTIDTPLDNFGTLAVQSGATLTLTKAFSQLAESDNVNATRLNGGTITSSQPLSFQTGILAGSGTINANMSLSDKMLLFFQLGGTVAGSGTDKYDFLNVNGTTSLGGILALNFKNNFENQINGSDNFTLLSSSSALAGSFKNVANGSRLDTVDGFGSFVVNYAGSVLNLTNFVPNTRWLGGDGNWTEGAKWSSSPLFPNNTGSTSYSATIHGGTVNLDANITVSRLLLTGGNLAGGNTLTVTDGLIWTSGALSGTPDSIVSLEAGSVSTIGPMNDGSVTTRILNGRTLNNSGMVNQTDNIGGTGGIINNLTGATWNASNQGFSPLRIDVPAFNNAGSFVAVTPTNVGGDFNNYGTVTIQSTSNNTLTLTGGSSSGTFNVEAGAKLVFFTGPGAPYTLLAGTAINGTGLTDNIGMLAVTGNTTIATDFMNEGRLDVAPGATLTFNGAFTQPDLSGFEIHLAGGTIVANQGIFISGGRLSGSGTISGNVSTGGSVAPGDSVGQITINGNLEIGFRAGLQMQIGGLGQGAGYDHITVNGSFSITTLFGSNLNILSLQMLNGFESQLDGSQIFNLLTSNSAITGVFANVGNGERLQTFDGLASFQVNYGTGSPFGANNLVLSNGTVIPEPAIPTLLVLGCVALAGLGRQKRLCPLKPRLDICAESQCS